MPRDERKPEQQTKQVREDRPLVPEVSEQAVQTGSVRKTRTRYLIEHDCGKPDGGDWQGVPMEQRDTEQRQPKQHELRRQDGEAHRPRPRRRCDWRRDT